MNINNFNYNMNIYYINLNFKNINILGSQLFFLEQPIIIIILITFSWAPYYNPKKLVHSAR